MENDLKSSLKGKKWELSGFGFVHYLYDCYWFVTWKEQFKAMPSAFPRGSITLQRHLFQPHLKEHSLHSVKLAQPGECWSSGRAECVTPFCLQASLLGSESCQSCLFFRGRRRWCSACLPADGSYLFLLHLFSLIYYHSLQGGVVGFVFSIGFFFSFCCCCSVFIFVYVFVRVLARNYTQIILCREMSEVPLWVCALKWPHLRSLSFVLVVHSCRCADAMSLIVCLSHQCYSPLQRSRLIEHTPKCLWFRLPMYCFSFRGFASVCLSETCTSSRGNSNSNNSLTKFYYSANKYVLI